MTIDSTVHLDSYQGAISEFGEALGELVRRCSGSLGAVITDNDDDIVDLVYLTSQTTHLDLALFGAQIGRTMARVHSFSVASGFGSPYVILEAERAHIISHKLLHEYLLTLVLDSNSNIARALRELECSAERLSHMLL